MEHSDIPSCRTCKKVEELATASNVDKGLMWDGIYEEWICQECVRINIKRVPVRF